MTDMFFDDYESEDAGYGTGSKAICRCAQCGYGICGMENAVEITATGEVIHKDCWYDYAQDNAEEFIRSIV